MTTPDPAAAAWAALHAHREEIAGTSLAGLFEADPGRFERLSLRLDDLRVDFSKTRATGRTIALLADLAAATGVAERRDEMFAGAPINATEGRAVLHVALRNRSGRPILVDGTDVMPEVDEVLARLRAFAGAVRDGSLRGAGGRAFTDVVNIGIGGSDLGPAMAIAALVPYHDGPRVHCVSNVDGAHLADTLAGLDPATTLVIVASKTFTTIETMTNARSARAWIAGTLGEDAVADHFAAISTALDRVAAFGIDAGRTFGFWDWVGGRYSVWSAIGLPLMIAIGPDRFDDFLAGAHVMDEHFRSAPPPQNAPMLLGLIGVWHRNVWGHGSRVVIPYDQRLARLPAYLQQLDMESNGKRVTLDGAPVAGATGPVVWGEPGTNGQHAFFQLLHQGTDVVPVELMVAAQGHEPDLAEHHAILVANCLAQSEALMRGRTLEEATRQLEARGLPASEVARLAPHRVFPGDRPSITIAYRRLDPFTLGRLLALYEHRVFVEGAIWGINSFDQWGVELGKELATGLLPMVKGEAPADRRDPSTRGLLAHLTGLKE